MASATTSSSSSSSNSALDAAAFTSSQPFDAYTACDALILALCTVLLALQFGVRMFKSRAGPLTHHYLALLAWAFVLAGLGGDFWRLDLSRKVQDTTGKILSDPNLAMTGLDNIVQWGVGIAKWTYVAPLLYFSALWSVKAAILCFSFNARPHLSTGARLAVYASAVYLGATYVVLMFAQAFWCTPRSNWDVDGTLCTPYMSLAFIAIAFVFSLTTDLLLLGVTVFVASRTHLNPTERQLLPVPALFGLLSIGCAIARFTQQLHVHAELRGLRSTRSGNGVWTWSAIELGAAFAACTLPSLRVLFFKKHTKTGISSQSYSGAAAAAAAGYPAAVRSTGGNVPFGTARFAGYVHYAGAGRAANANANANTQSGVWDRPYLGHVNGLEMGEGRKLVGENGSVRAASSGKSEAGTEPDVDTAVEKVPGSQV